MVKYNMHCIRKCTGKARKRLRKNVRTWIWVDDKDCEEIKTIIHFSF